MTTRVDGRESVVCGVGQAGGLAIGWTIGWGGRWTIEWGGLRRNGWLIDVR